VRWNAFDCVPNQNVVEFYTCIVIEPERSLVSANISYNRDFHKVNLNFVLLMSRPGYNDYQKIFDLNVDLCQLHKTSYKNMFLMIAYRTLLSGTNLPKMCPQRKVSYTSLFQLLITNIISGILLLSQFKPWGASTAIFTKTWI